MITPVNKSWQIQQSEGIKSCFDKTKEQASILQIRYSKKQHNHLFSRLEFLAREGTLMRRFESSE